MRQLASSSRARMIIFPGILALMAGCTVRSDSPAQASATGPMEGCGMMVNGQMVYKETAGSPCMTMNKPGNMMPNGVTMHSDPK